MPVPLNAKGRFDRLVRFACGHTAFSAKAAGETTRTVNWSIAVCKFCSTLESPSAREELVS
jgi:hypothetical protein